MFIVWCVFIQVLTVACDARLKVRLKKGTSYGPWSPVFEARAMRNAGQLGRIARDVQERIEARASAARLSTTSGTGGASETEERRLSESTEPSSVTPQWQLSMAQIQELTEELSPSVRSEIEALYPSVLQDAQDLLAVVPTDTSVFRSAVSYLYEGMQLADKVLSVGKAVAAMVVSPDPLGAPLQTLLTTVYDMVKAVQGFGSSDSDDDTDATETSVDIVDPDTIIYVVYQVEEGLAEVQAIVDEGVSEATALYSKMEECKGIMSDVPSLPLSDILSGKAALEVSTCLQQMQTIISEAPLLSQAIASSDTLQDVLAFLGSVVDVIESTRTSKGQVVMEALGFGMEVVKKVVALGLNLGGMSFNEVVDAGLQLVSDLTDESAQTATPRVGRELGNMLASASDILDALPALQTPLLNWSEETEKDAAEDLNIALVSLRTALQYYQLDDSSLALSTTSNDTTAIDTASVREIAVLRASINVKTQLQANHSLIVPSLPTEELSVLVNALNPVVGGAGSVIIPAMAVVLSDARTLIQDIGTLIRILAGDGDKRQIDAIVSQCVGAAHHALVVRQFT